MTPPLAHRIPAHLAPDPARVVARLFLPGEEPHQGRSRVGGIADRVLALTEDEVRQLAAQVGAGFATRHPDLPAILAGHAAILASRLDGTPLTAARTLVLGASLTAEYATESAALCNPSAVEHPDQTGLEPGQLRAAISLRAIGEGHTSSIAFCTAVIGPGARWSFLDRDRPVVTGATSPARWSTDQLRAVLADHGATDELGTTLLYDLPDQFDITDLESTLSQAPGDLVTRPGAPATIDLLRRIVASVYQVDFPADSTLAQRVLLPTTADESDGMEDARFTRFHHDDGTIDYRATYTAYDGRHIAPRLLRSPDLRRFRTDRLAGPAARNKGIALFPRPVDGRHLALCRTDGENISLASSPDGLTWSAPALLHGPTRTWEMLQVGNCGPPIETARGWLVLTHGVGLMRTYAIGAILLDLADPSRVIGALRRPLLTPNDTERDGYVPNVVYSCGGLLHDGRLWLPYGVDDSRIAVAWVDLDELLDELLGAERPIPMPADSDQARASSRS
jgi:predicted GH43/DUF377 family glycosyl hydrolase